jgi:hypothetical protein
MVNGLGLPLNFVPLEKQSHFLSAATLRLERVCINVKTIRERPYPFKTYKNNLAV